MKSIISNEEKCYICGRRYGLEAHHCLHGSANRKLADKYGLVVYLCSRCHYTLHNQDKSLDRYMEQVAQKAFEQKYSHEDYMKLFRKNYL